MHRYRAIRVKLVVICSRGIHIHPTELSKSQRRKLMHGRHNDLAIARRSEELSEIGTLGQATVDRDTVTEVDRFGSGID